MKSDLLDTLFGARDQISDVLIETVPTSPDELQMVRQLFMRRDRLSGLINQVLETMFKPRDIAGELDALDQISGKLARVARNISGVRDAIDLTDQAIKVVTSLVALAA